MRRVAIVSGGTSGIGEKCAEKLASCGYRVYATGRRVKSMGAAKAYTEVRCDVTQEDSVRELVNRVVEEQGRIDVLVNCAGYALGGGVEDTSVEEAQAQFDTNFFGTHRMIRTVLPMMRNQQQGKIITVSSVASEFAVPFQGFYSCSKMALDGMMLALRLEVKPFGIEVACVNPGDVRSGFTDGRHQASGCVPESPYYEMAMRSIETMKRDELHGMAPEQVAQLVARLASASRLKPKYFVETKYRLVMVLKRLLPLTVVEKLLAAIYLGEEKK